MTPEKASRRTRQGDLSIDSPGWMAAYSVGRVASGPRCCRPSNADPVGGGGRATELLDANDLLKPGYLDVESGYTRLPDGRLHVACWTTMPRCTGRMVEWWFGYLETTEQYKWWHPRDHVWCEWIGERGTGRFIGGTHHVHEYIGGELQKLRINFRDPADYLDASRLEEAGITAAVCARIGPLEAPVWAGHLIHLCRDTEYGCEMRSRFWLGDFDPPGLAPDRQTRIQLFPDRVGEGLLKHCHEEMTYLAGFLPELYATEA